MNGERCLNMNHGRTQNGVRFCPSCGVLLNARVLIACDPAKHASYRKQRHPFCLCCGKKL